MTAQRIELEPRTMAGVREQPRMDNLTEFMGRAFDTAATAIGEQGAHPAGPPISLYHGTATDIVDVTAGFPVAQPVAPTPGAGSTTGGISGGGG